MSWCAPTCDHGRMFHVSFSSGSVFSGKHVTVWDLDDAALRERVLDPRTRGDEVWVEGQPYSWSDSVVRIFAGPPSDEIEDFSSLLGAPAYALSGALTEVTDQFIQGPPGGEPAEAAIRVARSSHGSNVFVVHGAHVAWREQTARFLEQVLGPDHRTVILHEQTNQGQTIIEKLESAAREAQYAVVLLTGDDEGRRQGDDLLEPRARQNVVLELGYFLGVLGRRNVCVLYETGVELPSDIHGLVYIQLDDANGWQLSLFRELRAAGLDAELR